MSERNIRKGSGPVPRGRLKIFFSYCRAVDRTEQMAQNAARSKLAPLGGTPAEGTACRMEYLPYTGRFEYGRRTEAFDLDLALARRPELLLLQDAARINPEGCRHRLRCRDIEELLRAGISVYTTLDVTDLDGLSDMTATVLGGRVSSGVPDTFFDQADEVLFIDADPTSLDPEQIAALGLPEQGEAALRRLRGLREMAMRRMTDRLSHPGKNSAPAAGAHVLVCISPSPSNAKVIRSAARMAGAFHGRFTALYVEGGKPAQGELDKNLRLAEQLGAVITTVYGDDPALQIAEYARASGVTKVVIGRTNHRRRLPWKPRSLVDRLIVLLPEVDVYIIPDARPLYRAGKGPRLPLSRLASPPLDLLRALIVVAAASLIGGLFDAFDFREADIITVYLLGMVIAAIWTRGWTASILSAFLSVMLFNFLFTEPRFTLFAYDAGYFTTFVVMLASGLITGSLAAQIKKQTRQAARQAYRTETLLETSRLLQKAEDETAIFDRTARQLGKLLERPILLYPQPDMDKAGSLSVYPFARGQDCTAYQSAEERQAAHWVYLNNKHAGAATDSFPQVHCHYLAIRGRSGALAVAGIPIDGFPVLDAFGKSLMVAILDECGLALDKERLRREKQAAEMAVEQEALRANLLRAVSHDLRTPLTGIQGSAGVLLDSGEQLPTARRKALYRSIHDDAIWLIDLVENLLSVTRLENGTMQLHRQAELIDEIFSEALQHLDPAAQKHIICRQLEDDLLLVRADARLLTQVVINIVNNAIRYTQEGSEILLSAKREGDRAVIRISDNGPGVSDADKPKLFDMFYTTGKLRGDGRRGLGLGLALCRSIIRAHGGEIHVEDNTPCGAAFVFTLDPVEV